MTFTIDSSAAARLEAKLTEFPRVRLLGAPTPLDRLEHAGAATFTYQNEIAARLGIAAARGRLLEPDCPQTRFSVHAEFIAFGVLHHGPGGVGAGMFGDDRCP